MRNVQSLDINLQMLRTILELPEHGIDLAKAKLTIDHIIDPTIDIGAILKQLDRMTAEIIVLWKLTNASSVDRLNALRTYLYKAGVWNGNRPVRYDYEDGLGHNINNKLLPNYLATRKGNCVSMPLLLVILGQKLGINITAALAPCHIYVNYRDEMGTFNLEATSDDAGLTDEDNLKASLPMTPESIANKIYLKPLNKRETVCMMMEPLVEFYRQQGQPEQRLAYAGLSLDYFPLNVNAMTHIGASFGMVLDRLFLSKYPKVTDIPIDDLSYCKYLQDNAYAWFDKAKALGWQKISEKAKTAQLERMHLRKMSSLQPAAAG